MPFIVPQKRIYTDCGGADSVLQINLILCVGAIHESPVIYDCFGKQLFDIVIEYYR